MKCGAGHLSCTRTCDYRLRPRPLVAPSVHECTPSQAERTPRTAGRPNTLVKNRPDPVALQSHPRGPLESWQRDRAPRRCHHSRAATCVATVCAAAPSLTRACAEFVGLDGLWCSASNSPDRRRQLCYFATLLLSSSAARSTSSAIERVLHELGRPWFSWRRPRTRR